MNFQQLEYVLAVHEHKHFGKAADSCHITQATLSAMIKKLEVELNIILFDRSRHPVVTTDEGEQFVDIAQKILFHKREFREIRKEDLKELEGPLKIGIIPTIANSLLPIILPSLLKENPKISLTIMEITTDEIIQQLAANKIDIGILATPLKNEMLEEYILYYEPMMVYGVRGSKHYVTSRDVKNKKVWLLQEGHCFRSQAMTICEVMEMDKNAEQLNFEGSSFDTLLNLSDKFGGLTLVPELYYRNMSRYKQKLTKGFQKPIPVREISIVAHRPYAKRKSINYLSEHIKSLVKPILSTNWYKNKDLDIIGI